MKRRLIELEELHNEQGQMTQVSRRTNRSIYLTPMFKNFGLKNKIWIKQRDQFNIRACESARHNLNMLNKEHRGLVATQNNLRTKQNKGTRTLTQLEVTRDIRADP